LPYKNSSNGNNTEDVYVLSVATNEMDSERPKEKETENAQLVCQSLEGWNQLQQAFVADKHGSYCIWTA
jgi:hypothetical protein